MPRVRQKERYVVVAYELLCGYKRAQALAQDLERRLKHDPGLDSAEDDTRGWDFDHQACVKVWYNSLTDAVRLDPEVRRLLSRPVTYVYTPHDHVSYGSRGPVPYTTASTSVEERLASAPAKRRSPKRKDTKR